MYKDTLTAVCRQTSKFGGGGIVTEALYAGPFPRNFILKGDNGG